MCHFITASLPKDADLKKSAEIFKRHRLGFKEIENESVREHLEKDDLYILTTRGMCDCGTILASRGTDDRIGEAEKQKHREQATAKLKAKGWSDAKIRRWQNEQNLYSERTKKRDEDAQASSLNRAEDWLEFIEDILDSDATKRVGILVHEYSGGLESRIKIAGKRTIPVKKLSAETLLEMNENIIYDFVR